MGAWWIKYSWLLEGILTLSDFLREKRVSYLIHERIFRLSRGNNLVALHTIKKSKWSNNQEDAVIVSSDWINRHRMTSLRILPWPISCHSPLLLEITMESLEPFLLVCNWRKTDLGYGGLLVKDLQSASWREFSNIRN